MTRARPAHHPRPGLPDMMPASVCAAPAPQLRGVGPPATTLIQLAALPGQCPIGSGAPAPAAAVPGSSTVPLIVECTVCSRRRGGLHRDLPREEVATSEPQPDEELVGVGVLGVELGHLLEPGPEALGVHEVQEAPCGSLIVKVEPPVEAAPGLAHHGPAQGAEEVVVGEGAVGHVQLHHARERAVHHGEVLVRRGHEAHPQRARHEEPVRAEGRCSRAEGLHAAREGLHGEGPGLGGLPGPALRTPGRAPGGPRALPAPPGPPRPPSRPLRAPPPRAGPAAPPPAPDACAPQMPPAGRPTRPRPRPCPRSAGSRRGTCTSLWTCTAGRRSPPRRGPPPAPCRPRRRCSRRRLATQNPESPRRRARPARGRWPRPPAPAGRRSGWTRA
mmetsp:Transcript_1887/g.6241  ORF Transcript_1887/g.6241 Transcript_1887/m.6241 type:complete len:388 (+) Transcript_1887:112-1275(+)